MTNSSKFFVGAIAFACPLFAVAYPLLPPITVISSSTTASTYTNCSTHCKPDTQNGSINLPDIRLETSSLSQDAMNPGNFSHAFVDSNVLVQSDLITVKAQADTVIQGNWTIKSTAIAPATASASTTSDLVFSVSDPFDAYFAYSSDYLTTVTKLNTNGSKSLIFDSRTVETSKLTSFPIVSIQAGTYEVTSTAVANASFFDATEFIPGFKIETKHSLSFVDIIAVPEPQTMQMVLLGLCGIGAATRTHRNRAR